MFLSVEIFKELHACASGACLIMLHNSLHNFFADEHGEEVRHYHVLVND